MENSRSGALDGGVICLSPAAVLAPGCFVEGDDDDEAAEEGIGTTQALAQ